MKLSQQSPLRLNNSLVRGHGIFLIDKLWSTLCLEEGRGWDGRGKEEEGINFESMFI